jgi:hypothetical protein
MSPVGRRITTWRAAVLRIAAGSEDRGKPAAVDPKATRKFMELFDFLLRIL